MEQPGAAPAQRLDGGLAKARRVQLATLRDRLANGERLVGYKTALLGQAARERLGSDGPVWGWFTDVMALADGGVLDTTSQLRAKAEPELVLVLAHELAGPGVTLADVLAAVAEVRVGIELPGTQLPTAPATVAQFVADNTSAGRFILGPGSSVIALETLDEVKGALYRDDELISTGTGARVLGHPGRAVAWLANALAESGLMLHAGQFVFTGAIADPTTVEAGHRYTVTLEAIGTAYFTAEAGSLTAG